MGRVYGCCRTEMAGAVLSDADAILRRRCAGDAGSVTAASGRYRWRNQADYRYCEQGGDHFTQYLFSPLYKEAVPKC